MRATAVLLLGVAVSAAPVLTYAGHGVSGGGGGGGGGHSGGGGGGGGHAAGGHFGGGGHSGGGGHLGGGGYFGGSHFSGGHAFATPHYSGPYGRFSASHTYAAAHSFAGGAVGHAAVHGATRFARQSGGYGNGAWGGGGHGGGWYGGRYWNGGYWHGAYWPHVWFNPGWAWFLPILPFGYATYWWGGLPYYYWNDLYYTWSPAHNGYVVTDPPPVATDGSVDSSDDAGAAAQYAQPQEGQPAGDVYLYPRNGQSDAQTQNDRYECHSWAVNQTGFDPTRSMQKGGNPADYRRAMIACLDARGYSAR
jgi:hypothetical protein